jgi:hypothetical protein
METIKFYIDFFGGGDAEKAWQELKVCYRGKYRWGIWVSGGNDPFAYVPPHGWDWLKKAAVLHLNATPEMLLKGVMDEYWEVRCAAVEHPNSTPEVLLKGVMDEEWEVRCAAVLHRNATEEVLEKGAEDEHWEVRRAAVLHLNATAEILEKVAEDEDWDVREAAARNPNYGKFLNN